jgi:hypothetical protein
LSFLFCGAGVILSRGLCWFFPGVTVGVPLVLICSPIGLPSRLGAGAWQHGSPPSFSVYHGSGKPYAGWGCGGVRVLPLLGGFSCPACLQHLRKIFALRNTCYLLPLSCHHLRKSLSILVDIF